MIDIHSHVLYGIDDGADSLEESISLLKKMKELGIDIVIATPHFIPGTGYVADNFLKYECIEKIKEKLIEEQVPIELCLGNEIFVDANIDSFVKSRNIASIVGSKYILIEFPRNTEVIDLYDILFSLRDKGYVPIIAHPERYLFLQKDYHKINQFLEMGCLFQGNLENVTKKYGSEAEKLFWYMLKNNKYQFLATDVHHDTDSLFKNFVKIKTEIIKKIGKGTYNLLTNDNPIKILRNENILIEDISPVKKKFGKWI